MNILWFAIGWFATALLVWLLWASATYIYLKRKLTADEAVKVMDNVSFKSMRDGKFVEWMRFFIFPFGIVQRTYATIKAVKNLEEVQ